MSRPLTKITVPALLLWLGIIARFAFALGPVDESALTPTDLERAQIGTLAPNFTLRKAKAGHTRLPMLSTSKESCAGNLSR
jgi:hypothetical protein